MKHQIQFFQENDLHRGISVSQTQLVTTLRKKGFECTLGVSSLHSYHNTAFILGRGIAGIPHFRKKSPKLSDTVRDKSPTLNDVAIIFKIRLICSYSWK